MLAGIGPRHAVIVERHSISAMRAAARAAPSVSTWRYSTGRPISSAIATAIT
jgi:hypothetical protein